MGRPKQVYAQVMKDLRSREKMGIEKYGVSVDKAVLSEREWMQHAYEESLDHAIYMKKLMLVWDDNQLKLEQSKVVRTDDHISKNQLRLFV